MYWRSILDTISDTVSMHCATHLNLKRDGQNYVGVKVKPYPLKFLGLTQPPGRFCVPNPNTSPHCWWQISATDEMIIDYFSRYLITFDPRSHQHSCTVNLISDLFMMGELQEWTTHSRFLRMDRLEYI